MRLATLTCTIRCPRHDPSRESPDPLACRAPRRGVTRATVTDPKGPLPPLAYRGARALVLGGSGFIGRWVARALTSAGARVTAGVRNLDAFAAIARDWAIDAAVIPFSATDADSAHAILREAQPDVVFNLTGYGVDRSESDADLMWVINRDLVGQMAAALARRPAASWSGQRLIHAGSALEYGLMDGVAREGRGVAPHTEYGRSKLAGTHALREHCAATGLRAVTCRLFTVYGPGEHAGRLLPSLLAAAQEDTPVSLSGGSQQRDFAYVEDVAKGLLALGIASPDPGESINLATGRMRSVREFALAAASVLGLESDRLLFGEQATRPDEMRLGGVDVDRFRALAGWLPSDDVHRGVERALEFERRQRTAIGGGTGHA